MTKLYVRYAMLKKSYEKQADPASSNYTIVGHHIGVYKIWSV